MHRGKQWLSMLLALALCLTLFGSAWASGELDGEEIEAVGAVSALTEAEEAPAEAEAEDIAPEEDEPAPEATEEPAPAEPVPALDGEVIDSGGEGNISWTVTDSGTLTFTGTGTLDYDNIPYLGSFDSDWPEELHVVITGNITKIEDSTFYGTGWAFHGNFALYWRIKSIKIQANVTSIGDHAFASCYNMESVELASSLVSIGSYAFAGCTNLKHITIPSSVTRLESDSFNGCTGLKSVTLQSGLKSIGDSAFSGCTVLSSIAIPSTVTTIGNWAFLNCYSLTTLTLNEGLRSIGDSAFENCTSLTSVKLPESLQKLNSRAFYGCTSLTAAALPTKLDEWGTDTFRECVSLRDLTLPEGLAFIPAESFYRCSSLREVTIPYTVEYIGYSAFDQCDGLESVTVSEGVSQIEYWAFASCPSLESVTLPRSLTYLDSWGRVFENSNELSDIYYGGTEWNWSRLNVDSNSINNAEIHYGETDYLVLRQDTNRFVNEKTAYDTDYYNALLDITSDPFWRSNLRECWLNGKGGTCFGISVSMIFTQEKRLTKYFGPYTYWELGAPAADKELKNVVNYYQLTQKAGLVRSTMSTHSDVFTRLNQGVSLETFLKAFAAEAKKSSEQRKPFIFIPGFSKDQHAVVVCGYYYDPRTGEHEIQIYDCNAYDGDDKAIDYRIMKIAADYSSFEFTDANGEVVQNSWTDLHYISIADLETPRWDVLSTTIVDLDGAADTARIAITAFKPFVLENAAGQKLTYDGTQYAGDLAVHDLQIVGESEPELILTVDPSDSFTLTGFDADVKLLAEVGGEVYGASAPGADKIVLSRSGGIEIESGGWYSFTGMAYADLEDAELVRLSGGASGTTRIVSDGAGVHLEAENCDSVTVGKFLEAEYAEETQPVEGGSLDITDAEPDTPIIDPNGDGKQDEQDAARILQAAVGLADSTGYTPADAAAILRSIGK